MTIYREIIVIQEYNDEYNAGPDVTMDELIADYETFMETGEASVRLKNYYWYYNDKLANKK